uniref:Radial spoke head component 4A n=1 Tax=Neogobius melanostomus TaxID=47308 RepID=A0A8C6WP51_9GOBI
MDERPGDAADVFEDISRDVKKMQYVDKQSTLRDESEATATEEHAGLQKQLFVRTVEADQEDELVESALPNLPEVGFYLEQLGVGLGREELQRVFLALKQLVDTHALPRCRFWGKIVGTEGSYVIAEAEYREGEEEEEHAGEEGFGDRDDEDQENQVDLLPQSTYRPPPVVPMEAPGTGTNKYVYYVCSEPGLPWTKLPAVTPAQINTARQIRKLFTGRLDTNYLRAQVARISAGTQVSPGGFYHPKEEDEHKEEAEGPEGFELNLEFEGISLAKLMDLSSWAHHTQHILQQGRCTWVNLTLKGDEEREEPEPEVGPPMLTPLSQDDELFHTPPWTLKMSSHLTPEHAVAFVRSNLWPGAFAYSTGKKFENVYVGWGLKFAGDGYSPPVPPPPQREYTSGPEVTEALDPTVEDEQELKDALEEQEAEKEEQEEEEEEEDDD